VQVIGLCSVTTSITEQQQENGFQIYPNPLNGKFVVEASGLLSVYDMMGEKVFEEKVVTEKTEININNHPNGIYFVAVRDGKNNLVVRKIVKM
jgi:hypothetical protein